ncbi:MAG: hypothetical protein KY468_06685 [Armatimonadetes bacterium]|nr:hypothetical protein [Armatimonadota bacterium]
MRKRIDPAGIVTRITLGVVIGGIAGFLIPYALVRWFNFGVSGTGLANQMKALFGLTLYSIPFGGIAGGFLAKRWNKKISRQRDS